MVRIKRSWWIPQIIDGARCAEIDTAARNDPGRNRNDNRAQCLCGTYEADCGPASGVTTTDLATLIAVTLLLVVIALIANYIPARRARRIDPLNALRYE